MRVVVLDALRHVDNEEFTLEIEDIVLAEICVDEAAGVEELAHEQHELAIGVAHLRRVQLGILEPRRGLSALANEAHDQHVVLERHGEGTRYPRRVHPLQVAHLLLRPDLHHLSRVTLAVPVAKTVLPRHVLVAIFEH